MEYTKGKWYVERDKNWVYAYNPIVPVFIADCGEYGNARANAHLIAAAPNMYEALKHYQSHQEGTSGHYCGQCEEAINKALAKAEGNK